MPLKKYRNQKSLKEDFKYLKPIFQMRTRPNEQEDAFKFLGKAISDGELKDQIRRFQNQCLLNYVRYNALVGSENLEHIANITPQLGSIHREQNSNLRTELMKYVLYQKE
ncbi:hypothetical protein [Acinetobacter pseudolwoffii]|uniref:hypothetical protein n=1 Tax=Acinetobacter pseudolwoffii TaxID=2053287 RepID=UPI000C24126E|nr:hypothetical protein [Acinetobacter pseudolwoffii]PJI28503.1 hypothetical protein CU478_14170 [Acinetobacter pseudolwoffii]